VIAISVRARRVSYLGATQPNGNDEVYTFLLSDTEGVPGLDGEVGI